MKSIIPYLSVPMASLSMKYNCEGGRENDIEICDQKALKFVPRSAATQVLTDKKWFL
jgi:hypothetical protein